MDHQFPVTIVDDTGANVAGARVCLVAASVLGGKKFPFATVAATHADAGAGRYQPSGTITPAEGAWALLISSAHRSTVLQPLSFTKTRTDEFKIAPRPRLAATVTLTSTVRTVGASRVKEVAFKVVLWPATEVVFLGGVDYNRRNPGGGWLFAEYGLNRAEALSRKNKVNPGTIVTTFSTAAINVTTSVKAAGLPSRWRDGWIDVAVDQRGDPATRVLPPAGGLYKPVAGLDIHVTSLYRYLDEVGSREPRSVKEVGLFSHSFPGGPILYDTGEDAAFAGTPNRDPDDFDARAKDWNATNSAGFPKLKDALAADCRFTVWGCSATTHFKFASRAALASIKRRAAEDSFFIVDSDIFHDGSLVQKTQERTSELRFRFLMDRNFRAGTYIAEAAKRIGVESRSACPGCGSDPKTTKGIEMLGVDLAVYGDVYQYFHAKFAPEFKETNEGWDVGYVDYHQLQGRPAVVRPPFSPLHFIMTTDTGAGRFPGADPVTLAFEGGKSIVHSTLNVRLASRDADGMRDPLLKGMLYTLTDSDASKSQAVFVQEDGNVFKVTKDGTGHFTVVGAAI